MSPRSSIRYDTPGISRLSPPFDPHGITPTARETFPCRLVGMANADGLGPFLHVTSGENSAGCLRQGLHRIGREERVVHFWDDLSVGPLHDLNRGAAARLAWWSRVEGKKIPAREARKLDDRKIWKRIVHDARNVVLWYGPHITEFLYALRACWMLRRVASRLYEVRLPPHPNGKLNAFYGAVGIVGPEGVARGWPTLRRVRDVSRRAERWRALQSRPGDTMRRLDGWRVREHPVTYRDSDLLAECGFTWTSSTAVIGHVVSCRGPTGDVVLVWRLRELIAAGLLEGRGPQTALGLPRELRRIPGTGSISVEHEKLARL